METFAFCQQCEVNQTVVADCHQKAGCPSCGTDLDVSPGEEVFISFNSLDTPFAQQLSARLWTAKVPNWLAQRNQDPGEDFIWGIVDALKQARLAVFLLTPESAISKWVHNELVFATNRKCAIIAVQLKSFKLPPNVDFLVASSLRADVSLDSEAAGVEKICRYVQNRLADVAAGLGCDLPVAAPAPAADRARLLGVRPYEDRYVGPGPYQHKQAELFFGRDHLARNILSTLHERSVAICAPSGAGKSSLINAKIRSSLEAAGWDVLIGGRMGLEVPRDLAGSIANCFSFLVNRGLTGAELPRPERSLADQLRAMVRCGASGRRVLILDQFEEIFTHLDSENEHQEAFFDDVVNALDADPELRVLMAFRKEFLVDFEALTGRLGSLRLTTVQMHRMDDAGACEVITKPVAPYATFAPGVAEGIVKFLRSRRVKRHDGTVELKRGQFIELVHLQLVCKELWANLEEGITEIQMAHLERVAGARKTFESFVVNVLQDFVNNSIKRVADKTGTPPELIHLGLLKFVGKTGGRVTVPMDHVRKRTGRLSNEIVELLAAEHLLHAENRGDDRWYELAHDLLVDPVTRYKDHRLAKLLAATDLLETILGNARQEREPSDNPTDRVDDALRGYFRPQPDNELLDECEGIYDRGFLNASDEAELVFRASLASGHKMDRWADRVGKVFPDVLARVLRDAVSPKQATKVRVNAVKVLGKVPVLGPELVRLTAFDEAEEVRDAAAASLAEHNDEALYADAFTALKGVGFAAQTRALAAVLAEAERCGVTSHLKSFCTVPRSVRGRARSESRWLRLRRDAASLPYVILSSAVLSGLGAGMFKWLPTGLNIGITQPTGGAFMGFYHGLVAGALWGVVISAVLSVHHTVRPRSNAAASYFQPALSIALGIISGLLSGFLVNLVILSVYQGPTLAATQWISDSCVKDHLGTLYEQVYLESGFGRCFLISGTFLGCAIALVTNRLRASPDWVSFLKQQQEITGLRQAGSVIRKIARLALPYSWPILLALVLAAFVGQYGIHRIPAGRPDICAPSTQSTLTSAPRTTPIWLDVLADCGCQVTGGFGVIVGIGFGIVLIQRGIHIKPPRHA